MFTFTFYKRKWLFTIQIYGIYRRFPWITPQQTKQLVGKTNNSACHQADIQAFKIKEVLEFYKNIIKDTPQNTDKYMPLDVCFMSSRKLNRTFHFIDWQIVEIQSHSTQEKYTHRSKLIGIEFSVPKTHNDKFI
jgi:hypothetical protein